MYLQPDWTKLYKSRKEIEKDIGLKLPYEGFKGWIESETDTIFVMPVYSKKKKGRPEPWVDGFKNRRYMVQVWNDPNAREYVCTLIGLPVHRDNNIKRKPKHEKKSKRRVRKN